MRITCEKLNNHVLEHDEYYIIIDANNDVFVGELYFIHVQKSPLLSAYIINGFRIRSSNIIERLSDNRMHIYHEDMDYIKIYKILNKDFASNFLEKKHIKLNFKFIIKMMDIIN